MTHFEHGRKTKDFEVTNFEKHPAQVIPFVFAWYEYLFSFSLVRRATP